MDKGERGALARQGAILKLQSKSVTQLLDTMVKFF